MYIYSTGSITAVCIHVLKSNPQTQVFK